MSIFGKLTGVFGGKKQKETPTVSADVESVEYD